jgi:hypothetical protein
MVMPGQKLKKPESQLRKITNRNFIYTLNRMTTPQYFFIADELLAIAEELKLPEAERNDLYVGEELDYTLSSLIPEDFDRNMQNSLLRKRIDAMYTYLGAEDPIVKKFTGGKNGDGSS